MILSSLARKVFDQVDLPVTHGNAWWVEKKLQLMQINGLVKMIQGSKKQETTYIDGYVMRYKWSFRTNPLNIDNCQVIFEVLQWLDEDFSWGMWQDLKAIPMIHIDLFMNAVQVATNSGVGNLAYAMAIYNSELSKQLNNHRILSDSIDNTGRLIASKEHKSISQSSIDKWEKMQEYM